MKQKRRPKVELSEKQIKRLKEQISMDASKRTLILSVAAMVDELDLNDEQIGKVAKRMDRYAEHLEKHRLRINEVAEIIEKETGIKFARF